MTPMEIAFRASRAAGQRLEGARLRLGWRPRFRHEPVPTVPLFGDANMRLLERWKERFEIDDRHIDEICSGDIRLLGRVYHLGSPVNWHRDPATGCIAPLTFGKAIDYRDASKVGDIKVLWELGRHQHLVPLAVAYAITGDARLRHLVVDHVDSWVAQNPFGMGVHWCSSLEIALRGISWAMVHSLLSVRDGREGLLGATTNRIALTQSIFQHGYFVAGHLSRYSSANNHLIGELVGLLCLSQVFDFGALSRAWTEHALQELASEIHLQVHPDGVGCEQAVHYQLEVIEYYLFAWCIARRRDLSTDDAVKARILRMVDFLRWISPSGGHPPQIGDSDDAVVVRFRADGEEDSYWDVLAAVDEILGGRKSTVRSEKAFWYSSIGCPRPDPCSAPAEPHNGRLRIFPEGGYAVLRSGDLHVVFDAGPLGYLSIAAHGHADALSFCAAWRGRWWLVDPGTYAYNGDQTFRSYFRGTRAHNTAVVNETDQSRISGPFMWHDHARAYITGNGETADGAAWVEGEHDGYRRIGWMHRRRIEFHASAREFDVVDRLESNVARHVPVDLYFHFAPEVRLDVGENVCLASRQDTGDELTIALDPRLDWQVMKGSLEPIGGWYSDRLGRKQPCATLRGRIDTAESFLVTTHFAFGRSDCGKDVPSA